MNFRPKGDTRLWDTFFFDKEGEYHLFYISYQGIKAGEELKGWNSFRHAVSRNLLDWEEREVVASTSDNQEDWDSMTLLTGNIFTHKDKYAITYGGVSASDTISKVGLLLSDDLEHWRRAEQNPVLVPAPPYEYVTDDIVDSINFRDVTVKPMEDGSYEAIFYARLNEGPYSGRGAVGRAVSKDAIHWEMTRPLFHPGTFNTFEVPDKFSHNQRQYVTFNTSCYGESDLPCERYPDVHWAILYAYSGVNDNEYRFFGGNILAPGDSYVGRIININGKHLFIHHIVSKVPAFALPKEAVFLDDGTIRLIKWDGIQALETGDEVREFSELKLADNRWVADGSLETDGSTCVLNAGTGRCISFFEREAGDFILKVDMDWSDAGRAGVIVREDKDSSRAIVLVIDRVKKELIIGRALRNTFKQLGYEKKYRFKPPADCFENITIEVVARSEAMDWFLNGTHIFTTAHDDAPRTGRIGFFADFGSVALSNLRWVALLPEENYRENVDSVDLRDFFDKMIYNN